ncbi:hypothetical protein [Nocardiopsis synnemataformans]|uniref:hypothetical protein n=1 Tax=Nocardiopsis synnemataformans TaxID=61305 RepID=UPI003EBBB027
MTLTVHSRNAEPRYLVCVEGASTSMERVYAKDLADVMQVLSAWIPTVHSAAVAEVVRQFNNPGGENLDTINLLRKLLGRG